MPCLIVLVALFLPRVALVLIWLFTEYLALAYETWIWPLLGFIFMPFTTLVYAWAANAAGGVVGWWWVPMILAILADLSGWSGGGGYTHRYRRRRTRPVEVEEE